MADKIIIDGKPAERRHIIIFDEDHEFIKEMYGEHPGYSAAVRIIIHAHVERLRAKALAKAAAQPIGGISEIVDGIVAGE